MKKTITKMFGFIFTISAFFIALKGDYTNGLLMAILGELVNLPYRLNDNDND